VDIIVWVFYKYEFNFSKSKRLYASGVRSFNFNGWSESLSKSELPVNIQDLLEDFATGQGGKFFEVKREPY
jgi:hypothetical protein